MAEIGPNWNSGGWADNGPGTGGWSPPLETSNTPSSSASPRATSSIYKPRGGAASFDGSKYSIDQFQYPSDLMSATQEYGGNYVIFYINIANDSKLLADGTVELVPDASTADQGSLVGLATRSGTGAAGAIGTAAVPAGLAAAGAALAGNTGTAAFTGALAIGGAAAISSQTANFTGKTKRIKTAIALHVPNNLSTTYGINYDEEDLALFATGIAAAGATAALAKTTKATAKSDVADLVKQLSPAAAAGALTATGNGGLSKLTGLAPNPRKEQIFKGVKFRTFQFDYEFFPRDAQESLNVLNLIYQFKLHMHPEFKDANEFLYIYPSEFDISYYNNGSENMNLNRHTSCVLTDMTVNYSPQGQFTTFAGGMPTQINVTLQFMELATLTKEKIQDGL